LLLLSGIWIDSVTVSKCQHPRIIVALLDNSTALNVKFTGLNVPKLNWGSPCIPTPT
jgi:hypothetical protein